MVVGKLVNFTINQLLRKKVFLGYDVSHWDFRINKYLLGKKNRVYIFNVNYTYVFLRRALSVFFNIAVRRGCCALVNENPRFRKPIERRFKKFFRYKRLFRIATSRCPRGILTNHELNKVRIGFFKYLPHILVSLTPYFSSFISHECRVLNIPHVSIIDTSFFIVDADYIIPGNEKSLRTNLFYNSLFSIFWFKAISTRCSSFLNGVQRRFWRKRKLINIRRWKRRLVPLTASDIWKRHKKKLLKNSLSLRKSKKLQVNPLICQFFFIFHKMLKKKWLDKQWIVLWYKRFFFLKSILRKKNLDVFKDSNNNNTLNSLVFNLNFFVDYGLVKLFCAYKKLKKTKSQFSEFSIRRLKKRLYKLGQSRKWYENIWWSLSISINNTGTRKSKVVKKKNRFDFSTFASRILRKLKKKRSLKLKRFNRLQRSNFRFKSFKNYQ